jgi:hypothetical protein
MIPDHYSVTSSNVTEVRASRGKNISYQTESFCAIGTQEVVLKAG